MDTEALARHIFNLDDLAAVLDFLEKRLPADVEERPLLATLRDSARSEERIWATTAAAARMAPFPVAVLAHAYGRLLNAQDKKNPATVPLLCIAQKAYSWTGDDYGSARVGATLADSLYWAGKHEEALTAAMAAAEFFAGHNLHYEHGKCYLTIANIFADRQECIQAREAYEQAGEAYKRAAIFAAGAETSPDLLVALANVHTNLGSLLEEQFDDFESTTVAYQQAASYLDQLREPVPPSAWEAHFLLYLNRAILGLRLGHHTDAHRALDQAEAQLPSGDTADLVQVWLYRGYQALLLDDHKEGRRCLELARQHVQEQENAYDKGCIFLFSALLPDTPIEQALALLDESSELFATINAQLAPAIIAAERARLYYAAGLYSQARDSVDEARAALANQKAPGRRRDLDVIHALYDPAASLQHLRKIADELRSSGDHMTRAAVFTRLGERLDRAKEYDDAYHTYLAAIEAIEQTRGHLRLSPQSQRFLATRRRPYERAFMLQEGNDPEQAFALSERARAQFLLDELTNHGIQALLDRHDPRFATLRELRAKLERAYARTALVSTNTLRAGARAESVDAQHEREEAERAYTSMLDSLHAAGSDEAAWMRGEVADLAAIQQMLDSSTAMIGYFCTDRQASSQRDLWAIVLTASDPAWVVRISNMARISSDQKRSRSMPLELFLQESKSARIDSTSTPETAQKSLAKLYDYLLSPIADVLASHNRLIIIPDEQLPLLPIHAAWNRDAGQYLIQSHTVSYAPSATVLLHCKQREAARTSGTNILLAGWKSIGSAELSHVADELNRLGDVLHTTPNHGPHAISDLLATMADARFIHLSCHGSFPADAHPRFAHLVLGLHANLYAHDLYRQRLCADLLTFSACDSGQHGSGLQGLISAGLVAGASAVVASMWEVEDESTPSLMTAFYEHICAGDSRAEALQKAQQQMYAEHPANWAPFFLTGVPD